MRFRGYRHGVGRLKKLGFVLATTLALLACCSPAVRAQSTKSSADSKHSDLQEDQDDDQDSSDQVKQLVQELFLGQVVYPQDQGELQFTTGYFHGVESTSDSQLSFECEYGITDELELDFGIPIDFMNSDEHFRGVRNLGVGAYYNFYNDRRTGEAYGIGFELGAPVDSPPGESRAYVYEPFVVAYQEYRDFALNVSGTVEINDPCAGDASTQTVGDVAVGIIGKADKAVPLLEFDVETGAGETPVRLAPGLYVHQFLRPFDVAVSFPIGLNNDAPSFSAYFLAVIEFEGHATGR